MKFAIALMLLTLAGCVSTTHVAETLTPIVSLPDGGRISLQVNQAFGSQYPGRGPLAVWKAADGSEKVMITLIPAPGSPGGVVHVENAASHFSTDGNRVWLVRDGYTTASFDYISNVAILGSAGQPEWAKADQ
jgi:hypothetical protein